jgi:hypothetical protein
MVEPRYFNVDSQILIEISRGLRCFRRVDLSKELPINQAMYKKMDNLIAKRVRFLRKSGYIYFDYTHGWRVTKNVHIPEFESAWPGVVYK